ncbi:MAG TPA: hypothetical protein VF597_01795 [Candidatus Saccharimonadales bacterium]|jgi:hypothetical protein
MAGMNDQEAYDLALAKYAELKSLGLRPGPLAEQINRETGCGMDAARLVVAAG